MTEHGHTYATLHLRDGTPIKTVSAVLGHRDVIITLNTYAHVLPDDLQNAADASDAIFG